jgi:glutathione S-transferase
MDSAPLTLTYFDLYGKAEAIRMLLTHSKTEFTDNRVTGESWAAYKASGKCANGQIPVLEVGDRYLNQSAAILRFIGSQKGYYGPDPFESHFADAVMDTFEDFQTRFPKGADGKPLMYCMFGDAPVSEENLAQMLEHRAAQWTVMAQMLGDKKFFGGDQPSIADFALCANCYSWERNTKGKEVQAHVYAAYAAALSNNATMNAWADAMGTELKDYLEGRSGGTI